MRATVILLLCLACTSWCKLHVYTPKELNDLFTNGEIKANDANFGIIPYGHSILGRVFYDPDQPEGCNELQLTTEEGDPDMEPSPIYLVKRGNCTFVQKVRNVEHAGGALAIVVDDRYEDIENVIMSDDGTGNGINIPSVLIGRLDGNKLINFVKNESNDYAVLFAKFELENHKNTVEYELWYTSSNDRALDFISVFEEYHEKFDEKLVTIKPRFVIWTCPGSCDANMKAESCFSNGKYCAFEHSNLRLKGRDILLEDLREKCIYENDANQWWAYMRRVHQLCYNNIGEDCSKKAHQHLGMDYGKTEQCVKDSFSGSDWSMADNSVLKQEQKDWRTYGAYYFPQIVINGRTYRGMIEPENVFDAICSAFNEAPGVCEKTRKTNVVNVTQKKSFSVGPIVLLAIVLVILNVLIIVCYRRYSKREIHERMNLQISTAVSQYFALQDRSNK